MGSKYASELSFVLFAFSEYLRMIGLFSTLRKVFFPYLQCNSGQFTVSCPTADLKLSQKKAQWYSNIIMCEIRCPEKYPREKLPPPPRLGLGLILGLGGGQFSLRAIVLEPPNSLINIDENGLKFIIV